MASTTKYVMVGIAFAVAAVIAVIIMAGSLRGGTQTAALTFMTQEHKVNIVNGIIGVQARGYQVYPFSAPSDARNVSVQGEFESSGGTGNDIQVYILDARGLTNYKNGHSTDTFYNSGKVTTESVYVNLSGWRYLQYETPVTTPIYVI